MASGSSPIRFGIFEVDLRSGELRKSGVRIHLADQPLQVLSMLLDHPGQVVTREELHQRLWSADTFVDFESGLNAAVKRLRETLGDSASNPRYIETLPRHGYRFIAPAVGIDPPALVEVAEAPPGRTPVPVAESPQDKAVHWRLYGGIAIALLTVLTVSAIGVLRLIGRMHNAGGDGSEAIRTIAVLPFVDMSPTKDQEYFADGLADELLTDLAKIPQLRVSARTSSFQFKNKNADLRSIGQKLNVKSILEGGVRKDGSRVRISVQLIDAAAGFHRWSESYDRELTDIFAVQAEIARAVAESLKVSLLEVKPASPPHGSKDLQSYNAYLQGQFFSARRSKEDMVRAVRYYEEAIRLNPNSARAWAGLGEARMHQADSAYLPVEEGYGKARVAVERALALDANLAKAHECMGWLKMAHDWNWEAANASFQRALNLEPSSATTLWQVARLSATMGHFEQALALDRKAAELNPLDTTAYLNLGNVAYYAGRQDEAGDALRKSIELNPEFPVARAYLTRVYLMQSRAQDALAVAAEETDTPWRLYSLALSNHALGREKEFDLALAALIENYQDGFAYQIAQAYAYRGDAGRAFEWLERAYSQRDGGLSEMRGDPLLTTLERDSRHSAFMKKMNLDTPK